MSCLELPSEILAQIARSLSLASLKAVRLVNYHYSQAIYLRMMMPRCAFMHRAIGREISKNAQFYYYDNNLLKRAFLQILRNALRKRIAAGKNSVFIIYYTPVPKIFKSAILKYNKSLFLKFWFGCEMIKELNEAIKLYWRCSFDAIFYTAKYSFISYKLGKFRVLFNLREMITKIAASGN